MIIGESSTIIARPANVILGWVLDLERYRQADTKIAAVLSPLVLNGQGRGRVRYRGTLRGLPTPADWNDVTLEPDRRLTLIGSPGVWTRRVVDFAGSFECAPVAGGTRVVHRECFTFKGPARQLIEAWLGAWLQQEVEAEVERLRMLIEADQAPRASV